MFHLLTETSIFVALPNDCLCQVSGDILLYRRLPDIRVNDLLTDVSSANQHSKELSKRKCGESFEAEPPPKRARVAQHPKVRPEKTYAAGSLSLRILMHTSFVSFF